MKLTDITEQKSEDKMKYKITFEDEQLTCLAEAGTTVLEVQIAAGMTPDAFCGGNGKCGKCKVVINGKEVLACKTAVEMCIRDSSDKSGYGEAGNPEAG